MSFFHSRLLTHSESLRKNTTAIHIFGTNTFHISKKTKTNDISRTKSTMYSSLLSTATTTKTSTPLKL
ncbi:hypothetical protein DERP_011310 [Dermatophagoides pteronyssinus]|uniref:Uncharacterized protein n=1 Tax=Dermatophagoides pteronyssinus TaxID=6956 RepID=A0ABQ8J787_DERPT|nr:hypothetical protein DERP_011310 [Dermatophagoides pteronyssinus]